MKKIFFLLLIFASIHFGQVIGKSPNSTLGTIYNPMAFTLNESTTDSLLLFVSSGARSILIDTMAGSPEITLQSNIEQLSNSNKWFTNLGSWTTSGQMSATRQSDSSVTLNNIPTELNPNPYFANWSYTDLLSGWNFTSGWSSSSATINDMNTFTASGFGLIYKTANLATQNNVYQISIAGTTASTRLQVIDASGGLIKDNLTGTFDQTFLYAWTPAELRIALKNNSAGTGIVTDITSFVVKKLIAPTGWTASTMGANNYIIQDGNGLRMVSNGTSVYISSDVGGITNHTYKVIIKIESITGSIYWRFGDTGATHAINTSGTYEYTVTWDGTQSAFWIARASACNALISYVSIKEVKSPDEFKLTQSTDANKKYKLSVDAKESETTVNPKLVLNYGAFKDSSSALNSTSQNFSTEFWGQGADTLKFTLSDTAKANIKNISLQEITTKKVVKKGDTTKVYFTPNTRTLGSKTATITLNNNKVVNINYSVVNAPQILASTDTVDFGDVSTYAYQTITFTNPSSIDLDIGNVLYNPLPFVLYYGDNSIVPAGGTKDVDIIINPLQDSLYNVLIGFRSSENGSVYFDTNWVRIIANVTGVSSPTLNAPVLTVTNTVDNIGLSWTDAGDELGYKIYAKKNGEASYTLLKTQTGNTFTSLTDIYHLSTQFYVTAYNSESSTNSNTVTATKTPSGTVVYVKSDYVGTETGSYSQPFNTIAEAGANLSNKKLLIQGTFAESFNRGSLTNTVLTTYGTLSKATLNPTSTIFDDPAIDLTSCSNVSISNLNISEKFLIGVRSCTNISIDGTDLNCEGWNNANSEQTIYITNASSYVSIKNSKIIAYPVYPTGKQDMVITADKGSNHILFQNNIFRGHDHGIFDARYFWSGYTASQWTYTSANTGYIMFIDNDFINDVHHNVSLFAGVNHSYIKGNSFRRAGSGADSTSQLQYTETDKTHGSHIYTNGHTIIRNNIFNQGGGVDNGGEYPAALDMESRFDYNKNPAKQFDLAVVNNTFDNNWGRVINNSLFENAGLPANEGGIPEYPTSYNSYLGAQNSDFINNAFTNSRSSLISWFVQSWGTSTSNDISLRNNAFDESGNVFKQGASSPTYYTASSLNTADPLGDASGNFYTSGSLYSTGHEFQSYNNKKDWYRRDTIFSNYSLASNSQLIDAGTYLTTVTNVSGNVVTVGDAKYFFDGWGMADADNVMINGVERIVTNVNYDANTITVSNPSGVSVGQGVYYVYSGSTADIGAVEKGLEEEVIPVPTVTPIILAQPTNQTDTVGGSITFSLTASLDGTLGYQWWEDTEGAIVNNSKYSGATTNSLTVSSLAFIDSTKRFVCEVKNVNGYPADGYWVNSNTVRIFVDSVITPLPGSYGSNLISNSTMESNITGYSTVNDGGGTTTLSQSNEQAYAGTYSLKAITTASWDGVKTAQFTVTSGTTYVFRVAIYCSSGETVGAYDNSGRFGVTSHLTTTTGWNYLEWEATAVSTGYEQFAFSSRSGANIFYVDEVEVREKL